MNYLFESIQTLDGNVCPICGQTDWYVMRCKCGHIFCRKCQKDAFHYNEESESITVVCECGDSLLLID